MRSHGLVWKGEAVLGGKFIHIVPRLATEAGVRRASVPGSPRVQQQPHFIFFIFDSHNASVCFCVCLCSIVSTCVTRGFSSHPHPDGNLVPACVCVELREIDPWIAGLSLLSIYWV